MCDKQFVYDGFRLWDYYDKQVSTNTLSFEFYTYIPDKCDKFASPKVKLVIYNTDKHVTGTFSYSELYNYHYQFKKKIIDKLSDHQKAIKLDNKYTDGFTQPAGYTNSVYTTIMYHYLMDAPCVRFMIGEKEKTIFDTDKVYIPLLEATSLYKMIGQVLDNYCSMSQNVNIMSMFRKYHDDNTSKYNSIIDAISKSRVDVGLGNVPQGTTIEINPCINNPVEVLKQEESESLSEDSALDVLVNGNESESEPTLDKSTEQFEFDSFLNDNVDKYQLDLPNVDNKAVREFKVENPFQKKILKSDFKNLETIITNCVNSPVPLQAFVDTVYSTSNIDLYSGVSDVDRYSINYIVNMTIKHSVNNYIQHKIGFPKQTSPIILNVDKSSEDNNQIMYFLLLSYIYINNVKNLCSEKDKNDIDNKTFFSYCLKTITSPFVFTYMIGNSNKEALGNIIVNLFMELKQNCFFNNFENDIKNKYGFTVTLDTTVIRTEVSRILDTLIKLKDKLVVSKFFNPKFMKLNYKDFSIDNFKYNKEILSKICIIEAGFITGKVDKVLKSKIASTDDIPLNILEKYGLKSQKYDNSVLIKYIQSKYPKFEDLEQIKKINENVSDIIDTVDLTKYPVDVLKCLYFWGSIDKRNVTFDSFVKLINGSSLTESELMSMIYKNEYKNDDDFFNSLSMIN